MVRLRPGGGIGVSHEALQIYHRGMTIIMRLLLTALAALAVSPAQAQQGWPVAGRQGVVLLVIVPAAQAADAAAYQREIARLCEPERTCFLNFYGNADGLPVALPLPDAVEQQATAVYRRSAKQGAERFIWSCRLGVPGEACF